MSRWGPDADNRLYQSAMQLIFERGYDEVTVAEIAEHAGLKKRSFFRYFADKREVMFAGAADFEASVIEAVRAAPSAMRPVEVVMGALTEAGSVLTNWGEPVRQRQRVVASSQELRERELIKMASLTAAVAGALEERGTEALNATLVAQLGVGAFMTAFQQWTETEAAPPLSAIMEAVLGRLRAELGEPS